MTSGGTPIESAIRRLWIVFGVMVFIAGVMIAIPKFATITRGEREPASKRNLGAIRSAISIYYGDMEMQYPANLEALTLGGKYQLTLPLAKTENRHPDSAAVLPLSAPDFKAKKFTDAGGWAYVATGSTDVIGTVVINCTHTDTKGSAWTSY